MRRREFFRLVLWELEENWRFPNFEILAAIVVFFGLTITTPMLPSPMNQIDVYAGTVQSFWLLILQIMLIAVFFAKSVADQIDKREIMIVFSQPVNRTSVFLAKFVTNMTIILLVLVAITFTKGLLIGLGPLHPAHYISMLTTIPADTLFQCNINSVCHLQPEHIGNHNLPYCAVLRTPT